MAEYIDSNTLSKLRAISILEVADELGMGLRYHNALCISHGNFRLLLSENETGINSMNAPIQLLG